MLGEYDLKRDLVEINRKAPNGLTTQCGINDIWNQSQGSPCNNCEQTQSQLSDRNIPSYEVKDNDIRRAVMAITAVSAATLPKSAFILALGTKELQKSGNETFVRTKQWQFWSRCKPADQPSSKDGEEMLIAIVLDRPLADAKALVEAPDAFIQAITRIMQDKQYHLIIAQMIRPGVSDDPPPAEYSQFLRSIQPPSRRSTHPSAAANSLLTSASGQREVPTVATHRELAPVLH